MNAIRRNILVQLLQRMDVMSSGFTFVERDEIAKVVNADFKPFASLQECCAAAEEALRANPAMPPRCAQVILCRYNRHHCIPKMQPVLKTIERRDLHDAIPLA